MAEQIGLMVHAQTQRLAAPRALRDSGVTEHRPHLNLVRVRACQATSGQTSLVATEVSTLRVADRHRATGVAPITASLTSATPPTLKSGSLECLTPQAKKSALNSIIISGLADVRLKN